MHYKIQDCVKTMQNCIKKGHFKSLLCINCLHSILQRQRQKQSELKSESHNSLFLHCVYLKI